MSAGREEETAGPPPRPLRGARLLRATRVAGGLTLALVLLHYVGLIGTPPPPLPQLGVYLLAGAAGGGLFGLADWLRHRARSGSTDPA
ncbi:MAG: hypothetical protein RIB84_06425 [Sneathiellaceae bacterium]